MISRFKKRGKICLFRFLISEAGGSLDPCYLVIPGKLRLFSIPFSQTRLQTRPGVWEPGTQLGATLKGQDPEGL